MQRSRNHKFKSKDEWLETGRLGDIGLLYRHFERSEKSSLQAGKRCMCESRDEWLVTGG